jgi:hypothetical protein
MGSLEYCVSRHYAMMLSIAIAVGAFLSTKGFRKNH